MLLCLYICIVFLLFSILMSIDITDFLRLYMDSYCFYFVPYWCLLVLLFWLWLYIDILIVFYMSTDIIMIASWHWMFSADFYIDANWCYWFCCDCILTFTAFCRLEYGCLLIILICYNCILTFNVFVYTYLWCLLVYWLYYDYILTLNACQFLKWTLIYFTDFVAMVYWHVFVDLYITAYVFIDFKSWLHIGMYCYYIFILMPIDVNDFMMIAFIYCLLLIAILMSIDSTDLYCGCVLIFLVLYWFLYWCLLI